MSRALLHLGFHKTGTSSAQHFLSENRRVLAPHLQTVMMSALAHADKTARRFSKTRDSASLIEFARAFHAALAKLPLDPAKLLLLSCEGLSGDIPGRAGVTDYGAVPELAQIVTEVVADLGYAPHTTTLHFSLREREPWLRSSWAHNIRSTKLDLDFETYARIFASSADFATILKRVQGACPAQPLTTSRLEDTAGQRFGPATPLLDHFGLPATFLDNLSEPACLNPGLDPALIPAFRTLNRGPLTGQALKAAKARLMPAETRTGPPKGTLT